jgi:hypothetical protein
MFALPLILASLTACGPSSLTPIGTAGSGDQPLVVASTREVHVSTGRYADATSQGKLYVFDDAHTEPVHVFDAPLTNKPVGSFGNKVWLLSGGGPFLIDASAGSVVFAPQELGERHVPIAAGVTVSTHDHPDFWGPVHPQTGDLGITSNGIDYVLSPTGTLVTFDAYLKEHPAELPKDLFCRGRRTRVCGTDACVKFIADPAGGERLEVTASPLKPDALPKAVGEQLFGPRFVGRQNCVRRLGDDGPLVVAHQATPGRNVERDRVSAIDLAGNTLWTVPYAELYGGQERGALHIDLVEDRVVVGAGLKSLFGARVGVATIDADGTPHPAP